MSIHKKKGRVNKEKRKHANKKRQKRNGKSGMNHQSATASEESKDKDTEQHLGATL